MEIINMKTGEVIATNVKSASSFTQRLFGLMFKKNMDGMGGLLLEPCQSVHNCFVRFPIDVIFLSSKNEVVKILHSFKPWRFSLYYYRARRALELPAGTVGRSLEKGDFVEVRGV